MYQTRRELPQRQGKTASSSAAFVYVGVFLSILMCVAFVSGIYLVLSTMLGSPLAPQVAHAVQIERHVKVNLNIVINQQGMQKDWPGYAPNNLVVPANSLVTVTLRDYDLGDTPLPSNSPFTKVQGTVGNANVDGKAYSYLAPEKVAHTFTIFQLHINVPLNARLRTRKGEATMFSTYRITTAEGHEIRQQRSLAALVLTLFALSAL